MTPEEQPPCFIILGRYGDIIQLLPAFQAVFDRTGLKPIIVTSTEYATVLEGVGYVQPRAVHWNWWEGVPAARQLAAEQFGGGIVCQWWADEPFKWQKQAYAQLLGDGSVVLQSHGREWGVDIGAVPNYGTSMWTRAGFTPEEMKTLPLVFDRRDAHREALLVRQNTHPNPAMRRPMLLVNFQGVSSPFAPVPEVMRVVDEFKGRFNVVDLGRMRAQRIYDLLGLMDAACGMITTDTATMHLAAAGNIDYVGYTVDGWTSSVPKGRCLVEIKYSQALDRLGELRPILAKWANAEQPRQEVGAGGGGGVMQV
jgi:hypothetical protein